MRRATPPSLLTQLRKAAPGSLTAERVADFFRRRRYPRAMQTILNFERAQFLEPPERFFEVYAEAIGQPVDVVRRAYTRTLRARKLGTGPFAEGIAVKTRARAQG